MLLNLTLYIPLILIDYKSMWWASKFAIMIYNSRCLASFTVNIVLTFYNYYKNIYEFQFYDFILFHFQVINLACALIKTHNIENNNQMYILWCLHWHYLNHVIDITWSSIAIVIVVVIFVNWQYPIMVAVNCHSSQ